MGGGSTTEDDGGGDDGGEDAGEAKDAQAKSIGNWQVQPSKEDLRMLKVINMGLNPKMTEAQFKSKLKPPPTPDEIQLFKQVQSLPPDSPDAQFIKMQIKAMKESNLEITDSKWVLDMAGDREEWAYTVVSSDDKTVKVKLDSGETNTLTFVNDNKIKVTITEGNSSMDLQFARKK